MIFQAERITFVQFFSISQKCVSPGTNSVVNTTIGRYMPVKPATQLCHKWQLLERHMSMSPMRFIMVDFLKCNQVVLSKGMRP